MKRGRYDMRFRVQALGDGTCCLLVWQVGKPWVSFHYSAPDSVPGLIFGYEE